MDHLALKLLDGCIMQVQHLSSQDLCPLQAVDCFMIGQSLSHERIVCQPGEIISNSTTYHPICFIWVYADQSTTNVLNQIGICSSVFSLLCYVFQCSCRISRKWWGLVLIIILVVACVTLLIVLFIIELQVSLTAKLLLLAVSCLMINVIQLFQFTRYYKCERFLPSIKC
jgi:hypothetical protein